MRIEILTIINLHLDIHNGILVLPLYLYLVSLQQPPAASSWPNIIFDMRIEILTLTNLHIDMHKGILECYLHICTWPASSISDADRNANQRPLDADSASSGLRLARYNFYMKIEIIIGQILYLI